MESYTIPVHLPQVEKQLKAANLIHLLTSFLLIANAWGAFQSTPHPKLWFVVMQIALSILILSLVLGGKAIFQNKNKTARLFRIIEAIGFWHAAWFFYTEMNGMMMSLFQAIIGGGLLYLWFHERKIYRKQAVLLQEKGVLLPAFFNDRRYAWKEIENLRIRNDYFSLNTQENNFIQFEVSATFSESELDAMNAWCFQMLSVNTKDQPS